MNRRIFFLNAVMALLALTLVASAYAAELKSTPFKPGQKVMVEWQKQWWPAEILKIEKDQYFIHYEGWGSEWDEWLGTDRLKSITPCACKKGSLVQVEWQGGWYLAQVLEVVNDTYRIHYLDWGDEWDEVVGVNRIREGGFKVKDDVMVEWQGSFYPATVLEVNNTKGAFYIRYKGYGDEWNEWVTPRRIYKMD